MTRRQFTLTLPLAARGAELSDPPGAGGLPRYLFFHLRCVTNARPDQYPPAALREIPRTIGTPGNQRLRVGASVTFNILEQRAEELAQAVRGLLEASLATDVPVFVCLDGQNWWQKRPDLWNWWNPKMPGYTPANRANVEWYGWGPEYAVKIGWRNWGRQIRVAPAPNLASIAFLAEHDRAYQVLVPEIANWYRSLPPARRYLFGGLKIGWEASINVNAYYYPGGNAIFEKNPVDSSADPQGHKASYGWTFGGAPLGYAAVSTSGIKSSGELTKTDIELVVHRYLRRLSKNANELGIPRHLIFTHQGGTYAPWNQHLSFKAGINEYSIPGYSFYSHDPQDCGSLAADLESSGRNQWGAVEWLRRSPDAQTWKLRLRRTLDFKACRLLSVYNWDSFQTMPGALAAVRGLLRPAGVGIGFTYTTAIGPEKGVVRRDPSDVIEVKGVYFVWYTKVLARQEGYPSGYPGSIAYATSPDGKVWTEQGICLNPGPQAAWDGHGVFTPNILVAGGKYYLFYTAVPEPFDVPYTKGVTPTAIGIAVAENPAGPWKRFPGNPVLKPEKDPEYFDSFRCDDASLIVRGGRYWLYYKGRQMGKTPAETKMGVAISENPTGPYIKQKNPGALHRGHEVLVWPENGGVASLSTAAGPKGIYFAPDGLHFEMRRELSNVPKAPGLFRGDGFRDGAAGSLEWGISHEPAPDQSLYLRRFDVVRED